MVDNGRVLGFDNAHGTHERHYMGEVKAVDLQDTRQQLIVFIERSGHSGDAMKTKVFFDGFEGHVRRSLDRARRRDKGERVEAQRVITFEDPLMMIECLTVQRIRLCQVVRKKRLSISALAEELGRNRGSVTRDVNKLKKLGLLRLREEVNPGHGVVQIVEPAAQKFEMRIAL
jgi:predicted transcriptional regulator